MVQSRAIPALGVSKTGMGMPRYFCDLDNGKTRYVDSIGTELSNVSMVPSDAIGFLAFVFKDALPRTLDGIYVVNVRNEAGITIFTTSLMLQSEWLIARHEDNGAEAYRCSLGFPISGERIKARPQ